MSPGCVRTRARAHAFQAFTSALAELGLSAAQLLASGPVLTKLLQYHIVPAGALTAAALPAGVTSYATAA